ncbi:MAG: HlyC/CorC family transporter [Acidobacteria bacterium]|nr:MAG: HlyC/CorC family transporter [Acidobacteriota bacterium]
MLAIMGWMAGLGLLLAAGSTASYLRLLIRRLSAMGARQLFARQSAGARRLRADRERVGVSISALHGVSMALFSIGLVGLLIGEWPGHLTQALWTALLLAVGAIIVCDISIPFLLSARHDEPEVILERWMPLLRASVYLAVPFTFPILISTSVRQLLETAEEAKEQSATPQQELQELIEVGEEQGMIEKDAGELIQSVVEFGEKVVREVMTPRPEIAAIEINSSLDDLRRLFRERRQTRYPVHGGQLDNILGVVSVQDLMGLPPEEQLKMTLASLLKPVPFVPETKPVQSLLKEMQRSTTQLAIVVDEFGSVSGLVTLEDLLEEIVGDIRDEVEPHEQDIVPETDRTYLVAGQTDLAEISDRFHVSIEGEEYSTVAGLLLAELGHVPPKGERADKNGVVFDVLDANDRTVLKVRMTLPQPAPSHADRRES